MIAARPLIDVRAASPLGRASPLTKLGVALAWLIALAFTTRLAPPLVVTAAALGAGVLLGGIRPADLGRALVPLWSVAALVILSNIVFGAANTDPSATELARIGPLRVTGEAVRTALGVGLRILAIGSVGAVIALTTEPTRLIDALTQQVRIPERFGYGALAAYQAIPRFADDLAALRQARRLRGLRGSWHPRLLVGLLVLAIRHADRVALAMDARAFGIGPRTHYREVRWGALDAVIGLGGALVLGVAVAAGLAATG